jgi:hypothetical protein
MNRPCLLVELLEAPGNKVFVSIPYTAEFNKLREVIEQAVRSVGYTPVDIGKPPRFEGDSPRSNSFVVDYQRGIQSSKLVIAVCSPDSRFNTTSPNVMHELGLAESLGKAAILLTNNSQLLPSNLEGKRIINYTDNEVNGAEFQRTLSNHLTEVLQGVDQYGVVINQSSQLIKAVLPQHWIYANYYSWKEGSSCSSVN